ncbi:MAG: hypothetical protein JFAIHJKO_02795 [Pyrinomonadaceae bacterium]|nr:hypothetical protein [Pyrinomonadaceae bacterium]
MNRDADRACLIGDCTGNGLADPPRCIGREFITATPFEFIDRLHQTDVSFLNKVEELQAAVRVFLCDRDDEAEVRLDKFTLRLVRFEFADADRMERTLDLDDRQVILVFDRR